MDCFMIYCEGYIAKCTESWYNLMAMAISLFQNPWIFDSITAIFPPDNFCTSDPFEELFSSISCDSFHGSASPSYDLFFSVTDKMQTFKGTGKSVGLCKTAKRKDQLYISLLVSVWRIISENLNPHGLILAEIWMKI